MELAFAQSASGGIGAAAGYEFQYLATLHTLVDRLLADDADFDLTSEDGRNISIDFALSEGSRLRRTAILLQ